MNSMNRKPTLDANYSGLAVTLWCRCLTIFAVLYSGYASAEQCRVLSSQFSLSDYRTLSMTVPTAKGSAEIPAQLLRSDFSTWPRSVKEPISSDLQEDNSFHYVSTDNGNIYLLTLTDSFQKVPQEEKSQVQESGKDVVEGGEVAKLQAKELLIFPMGNKEAVKKRWTCEFLVSLKKSIVADFNRVQQAWTFYSSGKSEKSFGEILIGLEALAYSKRQKSYPEEAVATKYRQLLSYLKESIATKELSGLQALDEVRQALISYGLANYCRDNTSMLNFFEDTCTNCQGQTYLYLSLITDLGIQVPKSLEFGFQIFADHVRPVILDKASQKIIDLVYATFDPVSDKQPEVLSKAQMMSGFMLKHYTYLSDDQLIQINEQARTFGKVEPTPAVGENESSSLKDWFFKVVGLDSGPSKKPLKPRPNIKEEIRNQVSGHSQRVRENGLGNGDLFAFEFFDDTLVYNKEFPSERSQLNLNGSLTQPSQKSDSIKEDKTKDVKNYSCSWSHTRDSIIWDLVIEEDRQNFEKILSEPVPVGAFGERYGKQCPILSLSWKVPKGPGFPLYERIRDSHITFSPQKHLIPEKYKEELTSKKWAFPDLVKRLIEITNQDIIELYDGLAKDFTELPPDLFNTLSEKQVGIEDVIWAHEHFTQFSPMATKQLDLAFGFSREAAASVQKAIEAIARLWQDSKNNRQLLRAFKGSPVWVTRSTNGFIKETKPASADTVNTSVLVNGLSNTGWLFASDREFKQLLFHSRGDLLKHFMVKSSLIRDYFNELGAYYHEIDKEFVFGEGFFSPHIQNLLLSDEFVIVMDPIAKRFGESAIINIPETEESLNVNPPTVEPGIGPSAFLEYCATKKKQYYREGSFYWSCPAVEEPLENITFEENGSPLTVTLPEAEEIVSPELFTYFYHTAFTNRADLNLLIRFFATIDSEFYYESPILWYSNYFRIDVNKNELLKLAAFALGDSGGKFVIKGRGKIELAELSQPITFIEAEIPRELFGSELEYQFYKLAIYNLKNHFTLMHNGQEISFSEFSQIPKQNFRTIPLTNQGTLLYRLLPSERSKFYQDYLDYQRPIAPQDIFVISGPIPRILPRSINRPMPF
ncbi:MAG: hypothetical protein CL677_07965 [Bdellovibrionaceae bacterium]|nr:hypothetical protein [Pseudobdellovibrionaceae bacterium]